MLAGWNGGGANTGALIRTALIQQLDANVFVVDWVSIELHS